MWWRFSIVICLFLMLPACGFTPIYAQKNPTGATLLSGIRVVPVAGRPGQILTTELEKLMDPESLSDSISHQLETQVRVEYVPIIMDAGGTVSRYRIDVTVPILLRNVDTGAIDYTSTVRRSVSYIVSGSDYTSYISSTDAMERGIDEAAYDVVQRVTAYLATR